MKIGDSIGRAHGPNCEAWRSGAVGSSGPAVGNAGTDLSDAAVRYGA